MKGLKRRKDDASVRSDNIKITKVRSPRGKKTHGWWKRRMVKKKTTHAEQIKLMRLAIEFMRLFWMVSVGKKDLCVRTKQRLRNKKKICAEQWKLYVTYPTGPSVNVMYGCEQNNACGIKKTNLDKRKTYMLVLLRDRFNDDVNVFFQSLTSIRTNVNVLKTTHRSQKLARTYKKIWMREDI